VSSVIRLITKAPIVSGVSAIFYVLWLAKNYKWVLQGGCIKNNLLQRCSSSWVVYASGAGMCGMGEDAAMCVAVPDSARARMHCGIAGSLSFSV
jgi:hypothetical protein